MSPLKKLLLSSLIVPSIWSCALVAEGGKSSKEQDERAYLTSFDLDGDTVPDRVSFAVVGKAHCCYKPHIFLSSDSVERSYPFQMKGGYEGGIDGSKPERFRIEDLDGDSLHEVFMRLDVYKDRERELPRKWEEEYGISKRRIYFDLKDDSLRVLDME